MSRHGAPAASFLGAKPAPEVLGLSRCWKRISVDQWKVVLQAVVGYQQGKTFRGPEFQRLCSSQGLEEALAQSLFTGALKLLRLAIRSVSVTEQQLREDVKEIHMSEPFVKLFLIAVKAARAQADALAAASRPHLRQMMDLDWRVDVTIATSSLTRVLKASALVGVTCDDGSQHMFQASPESIQLLRYQVAKVLKDMDDMEDLAILKIKG